MAVTQQLVRVPEVLLAECRRSVEELDRLCSFELVPSLERLDLDWAPTALLVPANWLAFAPITSLR